MAIKLNSSRQYPLIATVVVNYDDITSGVAEMAVSLPGGARVLGGRVGVTTAMDSGTSDAITVGDSTTANKYLTSTSIAATGLTEFTAVDDEAGSLDDIYITVTSVGTAATAGTFFVEVEYIIDGRGNEAQP